MAAAKIVKARLSYVVSHRGHARLLAITYVIWLALATWFYWLPLPAAPQAPDATGVSRVVACADVVLDYDACAASENSKVALYEAMRRVSIVLGLPLLLALSLVVVIFGYEWVKEGYGHPSSNRSRSG